MSGFGVYVHFPYCLRKCPYCDFATLSPDDVPEEEFTRAVTAEISSWTKRATTLDLASPEEFVGRNATSVFLGGGTPSLFDPRRIERVLSGIEAVFGIASDAEITLEANPGTAEAERFTGYRAAGVNRLSIGVQSLDDRFLHVLGRVHSADESIAAVEKARTAGFENVSIDLIFAIPTMTVDDWTATLERALRLEPTHVSAYNLTVERGTRLAQWVAEGAVRLPDEDAQAAMFEEARTRLPEAGYPQYEISNFARPKLESRHNNLYWTYESYLGFGPSAHSFTRRLGGGVRWWNDRSAVRYLERRGAPELAGREIVSGERAMSEFLFTGLRRSQGVSAERFREVFAADIPERFRDALERFREVGLAVSDEGRWRLTPRGRLLSDTLFTELALSVPQSE